MYGQMTHDALAGDTPRPAKSAHTHRKRLSVHRRMGATQRQYPHFFFFFFFQSWGEARGWEANKKAVAFSHLASRNPHPRSGTRSAGSDGRNTRRVMRRSTLRQVCENGDRAVMTRELEVYVGVGVVGAGDETGCKKFTGLHTRAPSSPPLPPPCHSAS